MYHVVRCFIFVPFQFYTGIMIEVWSQSPKAYVVKAAYPQSNIAMDKSLFLDDFTINTFIYIDLWWIFQLATFDFPPFRITPVLAVAAAEERGYRLLHASGRAPVSPGAGVESILEM